VDPYQNHWNPTFGCSSGNMELTIANHFVYMHHPFTHVSFLALGFNQCHVFNLVFFVRVDCVFQIRSHLVATWIQLALLLLLLLTDGKVKVAADSKDPVATDSAEQEVASPNCHGHEIQGATINLQLHIRDMSQALGREREGGRQVLYSRGEECCLLVVSTS